MKIKIVVFYLCVCSALLCEAQGISNNWLMGDTNGPQVPYTSSGRARINFFTGNDSAVSEIRKMPFIGAQGNISDASGNLLMSSNGFWIADASGDTMLNGSGLAIEPFSQGFFSSGYPGINVNLFLPFPGDSLKYILFHQSGGYIYLPWHVYTTLVDMNLNAGLGGVIQKNSILPILNPSWGISACKHANGRDWWVLVLQENSSVIYKVLLTAQGISAISTQSFGSIINYLGDGGQPSFSPDGKHFGYKTTHGIPWNFDVRWETYVRTFNFNRCSGMLSELNNLLLPDTNICVGSAFSANSKYFYVCSKNVVYQIDMDSLSSSTPIDTVAVNDGMVFPPWTYPSGFNEMYRANNGKIYITGFQQENSLAYINAPDSARMLCDVRQHALSIPCWNFHTVPNHPNYFLGVELGSPCDTLLQVSDKNVKEPKLKLSIFPNPATAGSFEISYTLPQNKFGILQIYDVFGKKVFEQWLPQWSNYQQIEIPFLVDGVYSVRLQSGNTEARVKLIIQM